MAARRARKHYDSDLEVEELPPLKQVLGDEISKLKVKEKKRQEVINELFHTEKAHLRNLKVLDYLFNQPMLGETGVMPELARALFPNMDEIIAMHASLNRAMKERRSKSLVVGDVGDLLLERFDNEAGDHFRKACAEYCRNQGFALERLKHYRRKDQKLSQFLADTEADKLCRKLELKDQVPCQVHRLTKYPLLIENLLKYCKSVTCEEYKNLERALERSRHILAYVNQAVKECQNYHKLKDMQKRMETRAIDSSSDPNLSGIKNLDLTQHKLVFDGPLVWRLRSQSHGGRLIDLQVVLLEDLLVLLQRGDGDKLILKCQSTSSSLMPQGGLGGDNKYTHSPVLRLQNLLARDVATDKKAFFVINTSDTGPQIYELVAQTQDARKTWCRLINEWADLQKKAMSKGGPAGMMPRVAETPAESNEMLRVRERIMGTSKSSSPAPSEEAPPSEETSGGATVTDDSGDNRPETQSSPLVQPDQVSVSGAVTAEAQSMLTPIERLRRSDKMLEDALKEKEAIVAEILHIDLSHYRRLVKEYGGGELSLTPGDIGETPGQDQEHGLLVASIDSNNRLIQLISAQASTLAHGLSQHQHTADSGSADAGGSSQLRQSQAQLAAQGVSSGGGGCGGGGVNVPMPLNQLQTMAVEMNKILSTLVRVLEVRGEERHSLRSQLESAQSQLSMLKTLQQQILAQQQQTSTTSTPNPSAPPLPPRVPIQSPSSLSSAAPVAATTAVEEEEDCVSTSTSSPPPPHARPLSFVSVASSSISEAGGEGEDVTDGGEILEEESASVLNIAQTKELTHDVAVEETALEVATQAHTATPLMEAESSTSHHPSATIAPHPSSSATQEDDESDDDEPYQMIPENLPLPDDDCVRSQSAAAFASSPPSSSSPHPSSSDALVQPPPSSELLTTQHEEEEEEEEEEGAMSRLGDAPRLNTAHMVTDLDEAGEETHSTPTPSPTSGHDDDDDDNDNDDGREGRNDDCDSVGTIEDDRDSEKDGDGEGGASRTELMTESDTVNANENTTAKKQGEAITQNSTEEERRSEGDGSEESNNRTCDNTDMTKPIEI